MAFEREVRANAPAMGAAAVCRRVLRVIIPFLLENGWPDVVLLWGRTGIASFRFARKSP